MFNPFTYFNRTEEKPVPDNVAGLCLDGLTKYIKKKMPCKTALEVGKYRLALLLQKDVEDRMNVKDLDYKEMQRNFYIAYKVNEFLEQPDIYELLSNPPKSVFEDRYGMQKLLEESKGQGLDTYSEIEMGALFLIFKKQFRFVVLPDVLPDYIKKGSGYSWGSYNLHFLIKDLFEQCQAKRRLHEQLEKPEQPEAVAPAPSPH